MKKILIAVLLVALTLLAVTGCKEKSFTVTFDADGGTAVAAQTVASGEKATKPTAPEKEGYTFAGWFLGETAYDFETAVTADVTLKAKWTLNDYTVTFDADNGTTPTEQGITHGFAVSAPAAPEKEGYTFAGWFLGDTAYNFETLVTSDITLKAKWTLNEYVVTFDADNGTESTEQTVSHGSLAVAPAAPEKEGYTFAGWLLGDAAYNFETPVTGAITLKASWTLNVYNVIFDAQNGTENETEAVSHGSVVVAPNEEPVNEGFVFVGWFVGDAEYDFDAPVTGTITITAKWVEAITVTFDADNGTESTAQTVGAGFTASAPLLAPEKTGFKFVGWYLDGAAYDFDTPVTEAITLVAEWELDLPDLTELAGIWTGEEQVMYTTTEYEFVIAANGVITATYNSGYTDVTMTVNYVLYEDGVLTVNYTAGATEGKDMVFTVSADKGILTTSEGAMSTELVLYRNYTVTFDWGDYKEPTDPKLVTVKHGDAAKEPSKSWSGHEIEGWYLDGVLFDLEAPITGDITLVAKWKVKTYTVTFYKEDGTVLKEVLVNHGETVPAEDVPATGMVITEGAIFNGLWYSSATSNIVNDVVNKAVESDKKCYPGIVYSMNDIEGTWTGTDSKGDWTIEIDAAQNTVTVTLGSEALTVNWFRYQTLSNALKLVVNYTSTSETKSLAFTYNTETGSMATGTSSSALVIQKAGNLTVTFDPDNGDATTTVSVGNGEAVDAPEAPEKVGFAFEGWYLGDNKYDFSSPVTADITLVAKWREVTTHTVTVNLNGGKLTGAASTYSVADGQALSALGTPTRSNYDFLGWYLGDNEYDFSSPVTADIILDAKWKGVDKLLKIYKQDGSIYKEVPVEYGKTFAQVISKELTGVESDTVSADALAALAAELMTVEGSYYSGDWFSSGNGSTYFDFTATVTANKNMYANFIAPVEPSLEGSWTCVYSGKTYVITLNLEKDASGNIIGATATVSVDGGAASDAEIIRTYIKDGQLPQFIIKAGGKTYTIKQAEVDGAIVWQYSNQTLTEVV